MKMLRLDELESTPVAGVNWKPVRAELDVRAFGINAYVADAGELVVEPHDETGGGAGGHQELYAVVTGHATFTVAGEEIDAPAVTFVLVEPSEHREARATEDGTTVLALGGKPGEPFRRSEWEFRFRAWRAYSRDDRDTALALLEEGLREHPESGGIRFYQAWIAIADGDEEGAIALLREAVEKEDRIRKWIEEEADFDPIRARL
jgi:hypothetical protein